MEILDQIFENPQNIQRNLQSCGFFKKIIRISVATAIQKSIHHHGQQGPAAPQPPQPTAQMAPQPTWHHGRQGSAAPRPTRHHSL